MSGPGISSDIPAAMYHADAIFDSQDPTLSASIANILINQSPLHAWTAHPRLNPDFVRVDDDRFDVGTVAHSLLLEGMSIVDICEYDSWRTNEAKDARAVSKANGRIPLLGKQYDAVVAMTNAVARQLADLDVDPVPLTAGKPERTMVWEMDGVLCRARIDWLHDDLSAIDDVKTTARANPDAWVRSALFAHGCDVQAAFYIRGMQALHAMDLHPHGPVWRWLVVETSPPYALSVIEPGPAVLELANLKVDYALKLWKECLANDRWPGYANRVATAELPAWEEARWLAREEA
jgi:hypothetical protein